VKGGGSSVRATKGPGEKGKVGKNESGTNWLEMEEERGPENWIFLIMSPIRERGEKGNLIGVVGCI